MSNVQPSSSKIDSTLNWIKGLFASDPNKEVTTAKNNLSKVQSECTEKIKVATDEVIKAEKAKVASEPSAPSVGGKSRRKGTKKPKQGRKNKKTRRY